MYFFSSVRIRTTVKRRVLRISASTIDRLLKPVHNRAKSRRKQHRSKKVSKEVPVRTFADWDHTDPGYLEIDFIAHCGVSMAGSFIRTLVATDACSGWTEFVPLPAGEQSLVVEGLEVLSAIIFSILPANQHDCDVRRCRRGKEDPPNTARNWPIPRRDSPSQLPKNTTKTPNARNHRNPPP